MHPWLRHNERQVHLRARIYSTSFCTSRCCSIRLIPDFFYQLQDPLFSTHLRHIAYSANMSTTKHSRYDRNDNMDRAILAIVFSAIGVFSVLMLLAHIIKWISRECAHDLESCILPLFREDTQSSYNTFSPNLYETYLQDPEIRRMLRHERVHNDISGVYRISVRRLEVDEVSLSSDSSSLENESMSVYSGRNGTGEEESSET